MKVQFHYGFKIDIDIDTNKLVHVYIDQIPTESLSEGETRIVVIEEPKKGDLYHWALDKRNMTMYSHLLTFHEEILKDNPKAQLFHFPNTWVRDYKSPCKTFSVSTVVGGKNVADLEGHNLRHQLWHHRHLIFLDKRFYLSGDAKGPHKFVRWKSVNYNGELVLGASKNPLFDSMFHIVIENTSIPNYFSEKLLDCFRSWTVPIYYGCTNIEKYFNPEGIFCVKNVREIIRVCNHINSSTYDELHDAIEDNYNRALLWDHPFERLKEKIKSIIQ